MNEAAAVKLMLALVLLLAGPAALAWVMRRRGRRGLKLLIGGWLGVGALVAYASLVEPYWIEVHDVTIADPELASALEGLTVVHVTDIHLRRGIGRRERQLLEKLDALKPDLVLFTGDLFDDLTQLAPAVELLQRMPARLGIFGVTGDTDGLVMDSRSFERELGATPMRVLVNESLELDLGPDRGVWLAGVDPSGEAGPELERALAGVPPEAPAILLTHLPGSFHAAAERHVDLVLAGETHGGQVGIPWLVRLSDYAYRTPYMRGLFQENGATLYVNRGIGTKTLPIRLLCRPEIAVLEFRSR